MEDKVADPSGSLNIPEEEDLYSQRLGHLAANLLRGVFLVLDEKFRPQANITRLVDTVNISEGGSNTEVGTDRVKSFVDVKDVGRLSVQTLLVDTSVVNTVFFTTSDADLHFEPDTKRSHAFEIFHTTLNILFFRFFGQVEHVRRE